MAKFNLINNNQRSWSDSHWPVMNDGIDCESGDVMLARSAAAGDKLARKRVSDMVDGLIRRKNAVLCKEYCYGSRWCYRCTVDSKWGVQGAGEPFCDQGNDSYLWMLQDLTGSKRLLKYEGRNGAGLLDYISSIAGSHPFLERWKDWRFRRRIRVPSYISAIDKDAGRLFRWMVDGDDSANMAQRLGRGEADVREIAGKIVTELQKRGRLYILDRPKELSLVGLRQQGDADGDADGGEWEVPSNDMSMEDWEYQRIVSGAWESLESIEQFVLEAMVIDELSAKATLQALREEGISIKKGVAPEDIKLQDVYYFCRKCLSKLKVLSGLDKPT